LTVLSKKGTFAKSTSTGVPVSQPVTGVGFQPKALWLWGTAVTANAAYNADHLFHYGFSDGTTHASTSGNDQDAQADAVNTVSTFRNDSIVTIVNPAGNTVLARASVSSFDSDGFTLSWAVNNATAYIIHYFAVAGTDITNAKVINTTVGTVATGNKAYTGVGFQGNFLNALIGFEDPSVQSVNAVSGLGAGWGQWIGAATSATKRWTLGISSESAASAADTYATFQNDKCLTSHSFATGTTDMEADFVSWGSDGFTLNYADAPANTNQLLSFIVIKGGEWDCGDFAGQNDTNNQTITTATTTATPKGLMMFSKGDATTDSGTATEANARLSIGGADGALNQGCIWTGDQDAGTNMITAHISLVDALIRTATEAATHTSSTNTGEFDIFDMATAGQFTIDWTVASNFRFAWFLVSEGVTSNNITKSITESAITISEASLAVRRNKTRTRSETVTATD
jgi:hypothetical protein